MEGAAKIGLGITPLVPMWLINGTLAAPTIALPLIGFVITCETDEAVAFARSVADKVNEAVEGGPAPG